MKNLYIFSGDCVMGLVGEPTGFKDAAEKDLMIGDIVQVWRGEYIGTDNEEWNTSGGLTAIVDGSFQSFSDGSVTREPPFQPFCMGIKDCGFDHESWHIHKVKDAADCIDGEYWRDFGFRYGYSEAADALLNQLQATEDGE
jgi:hypothetical protein